MTVRDAIVSAAPALIAAALAFGPIGAWLANRRARNPAVWLVLTAITGPLGIAVLLAAPPGRCPWCGEPTIGFEDICLFCGESTRHARGPGLDVAAHSIAAAADSGDIVAATWLASGPPTAAADREPVAVGPGRPAGRRTTSSKSTRPARSSRSSKAQTMDSGGDRLAAIGAHRPTDDGALPVAAPPGRVAIATSPAAVPTIPGTSTPLRAGLSILAIGVFVQGSENLLPGARYLLARTATSLVVVGPLEASTNHAELSLPLERVEATSVTDRLVVTGWESGRRRRWALGFQSVNALSPTPIDEALTTAAHRIKALATR